MVEEQGWVSRLSKPTIRYRKRSRTVAVRTDDAYLRVDVSCGLEACTLCPRTAPALPADARHLVLPDAAALATYLEVFELPELKGLVLLTSVMRQLHAGGNMRRTERLRALYTDKRRGNHLFDNLHMLETAPRSQAEVRQGLDLLSAAEWYCQHLGQRLPVVVLSDRLAGQLGGGSGVDDVQQQRQAQAQARWQEPSSSSVSKTAAAGEGEDAELEALLRQMDVGGSGEALAAGGSTSAAAGGLEGLLGSLTLAGSDSSRGAGAMTSQQQQEQQRAGPLEPGVHILSAAQYFGGGAGVDLPPAALDIYDSIAQSMAEEEEAAARGEGGGGVSAFPPHLSQAAIDAGLQDGSLLQGVLSVSRRDASEGSVRIGGGELGGTGRQLLISGRAALNRAVHGDSVAVRLLPREQWRQAGAAAATVAPGEDAHDMMAAAAGGDGAETAADEVAEPGTATAAAGADAELDSLSALFSAAAAEALLPCAEVVGVLLRSGADIVACLAEDDERALAARGESSRQESVLCIPVDRRLPKLRLRSRQLHRLIGQRLVLRLDGWERGSSYPHGHLVRVLGPLNDLKAETDGVLAASGVEWQPFSVGALRELPPIASSAEYSIPPSELASRLDLRGPDHLICSIDPPGCTDIDDALSVRWLPPEPGGRRLVQVGVHIADVSHFVRQGGLLDAEAAARCTTVYLVDRRLDMLPALLSEDLCSLRGGQDRYAVSTLWTLDAETLEPQRVWYGRTLIRSNYQLEYSQAQAVMDGAEAIPAVPGTSPVPPAARPELQRALRLLSRLATARRDARLAAGALELESAELRFRTDGQGQPTEVVVKQEIPMMKIVAEMMIMANEAVARRTAAAFPRAALLRRHPPPRREAFEEVQALCSSLPPARDGRAVGIDLEAGPVALAVSLAAACAAAPPALASLIKSLATRAMSEAVYCSTGDPGLGGGGLRHYGLALDWYTHFTSPIRRYADVVVHRQLLASVAAFGHEGLPEVPKAAPAAAPPPLLSAELSARAAVMNDRHRTAKCASKDCSDLYLLLLLHAKPHVEAATVYGMRGTALLVFVARYHLRGVIHLTDQEGICRPPLRSPDDANLSDPYVLSYRRSLAVEAAAEEGQQLVIRQAPGGIAGGAEVARFGLRQRVWVELSAEGSRAHGPTLRMRLLANDHPAALEAARRVAAAEAGAPKAAGATAAAAAAAGAPLPGCGALPRDGPGRAYRPPGVGNSAAAAAASGQQQQQQQGPESGQRSAAGEAGRLPPPGFAQPPQQTAEQQQEQRRRQAPATPASIAEALAAALQDAEAAEQQQQHATDGTLTIEAGTPPPAALVRLQQRASRAAVLASSGRPGGASAQDRAARATRCRQQLEQLRARPEMVPSGKACC